MRTDSCNSDACVVNRPVERLELAIAPLENAGAPFSTVLTLVLWLLTAGVGILGMIVPYARPIPPPKPETPIQAETLSVELTREVLPSPEPSVPARVEAPPPEAAPTAVPDAPALTAIAQPSVVAFAIPVEGPVRLVEFQQAAYVAPSKPAEATPAARPAPVVQQIIYGLGEGRQPAPEYPYRARREGQEGTVKVRFALDESGRVISVEAASSSPWPLLNQAALRVVRERWRFRPGAPRLYEVAIRFQLNR